MTSLPDGSTPSKQARTDGDAANGFIAQSLNEFSLVDVLNNEVERKVAVLHLEREGNAESKESAVVILDKKPLTNVDFAAVLDVTRTKLTRLMQNDIYGGYDVLLPPEHNAVKATIIYPATSKHIEKYRRVDSVMVSETKVDYDQIVLPHVTQSQFSTQWVDNILKGEAEQERIIYSDQDFVLAPDLKWDGKVLENLYVTAIVRQPGLKSIRDLNRSHLPLLKNIVKHGKVAILSKYKVPAPQLRLFVHYQPSYYHFHVHFVHVMYEAVGLSAGKAHLLDDIIDNIEMIPDYYQKKTLHYMLKCNDPLLVKLQTVKRE